VKAIEALLIRFRALVRIDSVLRITFLAHRIAIVMRKNV